MCGRYASSNNPDDLIEEFEIDRDADTSGGRPVVPARRLEPDFNVAPTKDVYAVVARGVRKLVIASWGLVPSWAKDRSIGGRLINARMETVSEKPAFRKAYAARRCLLPADGYFEWYQTDRQRAGRPVKQPYFIRPADASVLAMAGLYEIWRVPEVVDPNDDAAWLWTTTVLTTTAAAEFGQIHDRMPLVVPRESYRAWLEADPADGDPRELLRPAAPGMFQAYPVSTEVNDVQHNGPSLIEPLPAEPAEPSEPTELPADDGQQALI